MDLQDVKRIVDLARHADLTELEVEMEGFKVRVKKLLGAAEAEPVESAEEQLPGLHVPVLSQHVGVFHAGEAPEQPPLVEEGDLVRAGQRVGTIQTLNVLSEVTAEVSGVVDRILVADGQPVEYGQTLIMLLGTGGSEDEGEAE